MDEEINCKEKAERKSCCGVAIDEEEELYDTCDSDNETAAPTSISKDDADKAAIVKDIEVTVTGACISDHVDCSNDSTAAITSEDYYMPPELLASDDSDTAGMFNVNADTEDNNSDTEETLPPTYMRLSDPSSADSSDGDDEEDPSEIALRRRRRLSTSDSDSDSRVKVDVKDLTDFSAVKITNSVFNSFYKRELGNYGKKFNHSTYSQGLMGNVSFVRRLECVAQLDAHEGCVNALNFNQSGSLLASGSDDLKAIIWDMNTYKPFMKFDTGHRSNVFQTKFMPYSNDSQLVTCARDGQVRLAELSTTGSCRSTRKLAAHKGSAHKLAVEYYSPHCLLSAGEDAVVYQIDLRQPKPIKLALVKNESRKLLLHSVDKNPNEPNEFLVSGKDHFVRIYDKRKIAEEDSEPVKKFYPHKFGTSAPFKRDITCAVYSYDGAEIVATYNDDDIYLFDNKHSDGADCIKAYTGHRNSQTVKGINFYGPRSEYIVSGSDCGNVFLWDKESTKLLQVQPGDVGGVVNVLEPHPHFPYLAVSGLDNDAKLFMPVASSPVDLTKHQAQLKRNIDERDTEDRAQIDGQLLWMIMQQLRQARRRVFSPSYGQNARIYIPCGQNSAKRMRMRDGAAASGDAADSDDSTDSDDSESEDEGSRAANREALSNVGCLTS